MAQLVKERARKPVVEIAIAYAATKTVNGELHYALEIGEPWKQGGKHLRYAAVLSKSEAMAVMGKWLETMAQQEVAERKRREQSK